METVRLKYLGHKEEGLPVTFPVGCKQASAVEKIEWANPFIDVSAEEAAFLLRDTQNWAKAEGDELDVEVENVKKEVRKPKAVRASLAKAEKAEKVEAKGKRGRPKEYGQPKAAVKAPTEEAAPVSEEKSEASETVSKKKTKKDGKK